MVESPGRITLWGIEVFVATAEEGSISALADLCTGFGGSSAVELLKSSLLQF